MNRPVSRFDVMSFIMYTPADDANERGYEQWLIDIDNPFFNSADGCVRYTNWKVVDDAGVNPPFSHFDFFGMTGKDAVEETWRDERLEAFRHAWRVKWARDRSLDPTANSHVNQCERVSEPQAEATHVILVPANGLSRAELPGHETWSVYQRFRGDVVFQDFHLRFTDDPTEFEKAKKAKASGGPAALHGVRLAAPP